MIFKTPKIYCALRILVVDRVGVDSVLELGDDMRSTALNHPNPEL